MCRETRGVDKLFASGLDKETTSLKLQVELRLKALSHKARAKEDDTAYSLSDQLL